MKVLVVGYGGREHALVWKLRQSKSVSEIFAAPGNPGIAELADCVPIDSPNIVELADFALSVNINLTVVGPEIALDLGIVDEFHKRNLLIFGPTKTAAEIESSKAFSKEFMQKHGIPTARFEIANSPQEAEACMSNFQFPVVLKADGLASGKGVVICGNKNEFLASIELLMKERKFGNAGDRVVIEEYLEGEEISFQVISDGKRVLPLATSQDHKKVLDGDHGPNTGGMGAYSPTLFVTKELHVEIMNEIILPCVSGMAEEGRPYTGALYAGLMLTKTGPRVLEFNARFGDPETQVLLPRMECDFAEVLMAAVQGRLDEVHIDWKKEASICVVLCSKGYPEKAESDKEIHGLEEVRQMEDIHLFQAGVKQENGKLYTSGGRVVGVTSTHHNLLRAQEQVYNAVSKIHFDGMHYRTDIASKALEHFRH